MRVQIELEAKDILYLEQMAKEGNTDIPFLVHVAVYNLIALWMKDRDINTEKVSADIDLANRSG